MPRRDTIHDALSYSVIGAFFEVYNTLGFGFLEHIYIQALEHERRARGHRVARQVRVIVRYRGLALGGQRLDLIVDDTLVAEAKSTYQLHPAATRQLYSYLRATDLKTGLLLHFGPDPKFFRLDPPPKPKPAEASNFRDGKR